LSLQLRSVTTEDKDLYCCSTHSEGTSVWAQTQTSLQGLWGPPEGEMNTLSSRPTPGAGALRCLNALSWGCVFHQPASFLKPPWRTSVEKLLSQSIRYVSLLVWNPLSQNMLPNNIC
jgi:hypothetical protein